MGRKGIPIILIIFMIFTSLSMSANITFADSTPSISIELDKTTASVGDVIKATIKANNIQNLAGYQVSIKFDPEVLQAVSSDEGTVYTNNTIPSGGTLITNTKYQAFPTASHKLSQGIIYFSSMYLLIQSYKADGVAEASGIIGVIWFKVLKEKGTELEFKNSSLVPKGITGTVFFDWNGKKIASGYTVIQPLAINASAQTNVSPTKTPKATTQPTTTPKATTQPTPTTKASTPNTPTPSPTRIAFSTSVSNPVSSTIPDASSVVIDLTPVLDDTTKEAISIVKLADINKALNKANGSMRVVTLNIREVADAETYVQDIPKGLLSKNSLEYKIQVKTKIATVTLPSNMLNRKDILESIAGVENVSFCIKDENVEMLNAAIRKEVGNRPVVNLFLSVGNRKMPWNNPDSPVIVSIPYMPNTDEIDSPEHIVARYTDDSGNILPVPSGKYESGMLDFTIVGFHNFFIAYNHKTFNDIGSYAWAKKQIEVLASKGVINGTSGNTFTPATDITRADFIVLLIKALGLTSTIDSNFDDIPSSTYYTEYVGIAKKLGVTTGVGDNKFNPKEKITRQDMMLLTTNALRISGKISSTATEDELQRFTDKAQIASYANIGVATLVKEGIVVGSGNIINPKGNASRAELAAIIYKIYIK